ncbi:MAG: TIGR00725 family protein [Candidatus Dormibacteraeota bacterium]|uniref:TIGR00725 family protein n=1 Tax=Candidatus Amunia macphersoniae TaxID=3127014 RepID=A0A934KBA8_9BACT|nr:TIGR00725 family protein [Candidatus Dormibacteraeota bacterium]
MIAVCGTSRADPDTDDLAERVGALIAARGGIVVCGGLGGVMAAAARGAAGAGGFSVGLLPGDSPDHAAADVSLALATGMGEMRNVLITRACPVIIAIGGAYGTLSEIALALRNGRPVIGLQTWAIRAPGDRIADPGIRLANHPDEAVAMAFAAIDGESERG